MRKFGWILIFISVMSLSKLIYILFILDKVLFLALISSMYCLLSGLYCIRRDNE